MNYAYCLGLLEVSLKSVPELVKKRQSVFNESLENSIEIVLKQIMEDCEERAEEYK